MTINKLYPTPFERFSSEELDPAKWSRVQLERFVRRVADEESALIFKHGKIDGYGLDYVTKLRDPEAELKSLCL
jgi:hypothetical protein